MSKITALRLDKGRRRRLKVYLDGKAAFSLPASIAEEQGLHPGQELSSPEIEALTRADNFHRCLDTASRYLAYRPRSEAEVRDRLCRRGFTGDTIEAVLTSLKAKGLIDDAAFARFWKEDRESFSPRSQWLTGSELRSKGVSGEVVQEVISELDDGDSAYRAAAPRARRMPASDYETFRRRLGQYLKRRGFGYEVINRTVDNLWREMGSRAG